MEEIKTPTGEELTVKELEQLEDLGCEIDKVREHQKWLKTPAVKKRMLNDPSMILYRLPLTESQREAIFQAMKKEHPQEFQEFTSSQESLDQPKKSA